MKVLESNGYESRLAGGCVRDRMMGLRPKDYDIATSATPVQASNTLSQAGCRVIPTGIDHGTITAVWSGVPTEITTLRRDIETDGRHATVQFGKSFEDDASRRDFTINAMFEDQNGVIFDFHNGRDHIQQRKLAFVGQADQRIKEDYLRILRLFRFWARFDFEPEDVALRACENLRSGLNKLSQERITSEMWQLLAAPFWSNPIRQLMSGHIWNDVISEFIVEPAKLNSISNVFSALKNLGVQDSAVTFSSILYTLTQLPQSPSVKVEELGRRLRISNRDRELVCALLDVQTFLQRPNAQLADEMETIDQIEQKCHGLSFMMHVAPLWLSWHTFAANFDKKRLEELIKVERTHDQLRKSVMPVSAKDLMQDLQVPAGQLLGVVLAKLRTSHRNGDWSTKDQGMSAARILLKQS
jgi:poly(A) polymerase